ALHSGGGRVELLAEVVVISLALLGVYGGLLLAIDPRRAVALERLRQLKLRGVSAEHPDR
ncbi:MAG: hypothetical protein JOZ73_09520, partial [Solirubrobacterales bacterium]|nr:hypothetical protein [Solirubrobacterales bacterium]